ncbi:cobalamin biosynthesis protein CobQ [Roseisalinus antarcticus]|uniref:Cobalamin biosynthesis protein CobQ n=1 Tax=Roseisalinus antarcticus TaxID=254357 RepID=A0A1Y5SRL2_9RHOB|nr:cobalamin biosynthesis protein CobQ [Roseisalinus antarcticus]SLN46813.1 hypothetical protein ROA7023_01944 [Roseisalinus antarcticus]
MNTPAHLIFGAAAFGRAHQPAVTTAAVAGALLPDLSLYLLTGWALTVSQLSPQVVFGQLYYSDTWQAIFRVDNSAVLWGAGLTLALMTRSRVGVAFAGAGLLHVGCDFLLHHDDARAHFWPLSDWVFESLVSYWDPDHHGELVGTLEIAASLALCVLLWLRFRHPALRGGIALLGLAELAPLVLWAVVFG